MEKHVTKLYNIAVIIYLFILILSTIGIFAPFFISTP